MAKEKTKPTTKEVNDSLNKVRKAVKEAVVTKHEMTEEEQKVYDKALKEALMPVIMTDADFKLGTNELDIRHLNKSNLEQMKFRQEALNIVYLKNLNASLVDITRLLMLVLKRLGVEDVIGATDDLIEELAKKTRDALNDKEEENLKPDQA